MRGPVTSPTFVLARVHRDGRVPLVHVDAYRLGGVADVDDLDLDATTDEAVTVVEWGQGLVEQLADEHLEVRLDRVDDDVRTAVLVPHGPAWSKQYVTSSKSTHNRTIVRLYLPARIREPLLRHIWPMYTVFNQFSSPNKINVCSIESVTINAARRRDCKTVYSGSIPDVASNFQVDIQKICIGDPPPPGAG